MWSPYTQGESPPGPPPPHLGINTLAQPLASPAPRRPASRTTHVPARPPRSPRNSDNLVGKCSSGLVSGPRGSPWSPLRSEGEGELTRGGPRRTAKGSEELGSRESEGWPRAGRVESFCLARRQRARGPFSVAGGRIGSGEERERRSGADRGDGTRTLENVHVCSDACNTAKNWECLTHPRVSQVRACGERKWHERELDKEELAGTERERERLETGS